MKDSVNFTAFKSYDIRGIYPEEINEELAYSIGQAFSKLLKPQKVIIGKDIRISSNSLSSALIKGLTNAGVDVIDIGLCGTEQIYFAVPYLNADGGIMITASHNPKDYNGMKFVREMAIPISGDTGLFEIKRLISEGDLSFNKKGSLIEDSIDEQYVNKLLSFVDLEGLKKLKIVVNAGNGCAGRIVDLLEKSLPFEFIKINHNPDGTFPLGVPNPLLPENREITSKTVLLNQANIGIAWDGDFDRCFFFDEKGRFIEGYYIVGLLAEEMLNRYGMSKIIIDTRLRWNTQEIVNRAGGIPIVSKTGHAFIKERMRFEDAIYGGEMSGHHYFRDFYYCDSGMIPWLIVTSLMCKTNKPLSQLVDKMIALFPCSGEINMKVDNPKVVMDFITKHYEADSLLIDYIDGLSMEFKDWRFNIRCSNTEPLLRLNVESRGSKQLVKDKTKELLDFITNHQFVK
ncbi:MAG: phosphomannomutase CpsG [Thermodesulfovibrionales bacterium]|nr:phosphomannomutase CpsG [Thermodesulfovibrionales bacterium]